MDFPQEIILERFSYIPETGEIINNFTKKPVTAKDKDGYIICGCLFNGKNARMRGARLVWVMHYGDIPKGMVVDHKNRIKDDNRLENLRLATLKQNAVNALRSDKESLTSKYKGVQLDKWGRWQASIQENGVTTQLGKYTSEEAAAYAYDCEARKRHGAYALINGVEPIDLSAFKSIRDNDKIRRERREGLPKNTVVMGSDIAIRSDGEILARFKKEHKDDAIRCADHFNETGEILDLLTNKVAYNKFGLPTNIFPCSTGFRSSFLHEYKRYHVGTFRTLDEAVLALKKKKEEVYGNS